MRDETIIREMQATPGAVVYRQRDETVDVQALKARVAELEQVYDIAAEIIGSDYRNVGVVRVALDFQTKKIAELESQLSANSNMVLVEDERHDQLLTAEARVAEYERILKDPNAVWVNMLHGKIARPQALDHYEECKSMVEKLEEQVRVLRGALVEVKQVLSCGMLSATEENCIDGPWLPAGVCCKIYDALAATEGLDNAQVERRAPSTFAPTPGSPSSPKMRA